MIRPTLMLSCLICILSTPSYTQSNTLDDNHIEYYYNFIKDVNTISDIEGVTKPFDLDLFLKQHAIDATDLKRLDKIEHDILENSSLDITYKHQQCLLEYETKYETNKDVNLEDKGRFLLELKSHSIVNKKNEKLEIDGDAQGGGGGRSHGPNGESMKILLKNMNVNSDCNDRNSYSGSAIFDFQLLLGIETAIISKEDIGDTIQLGEDSLRVVDIKNNFVIFEILTPEYSGNIEFINTTDDLKRQRVETVGGGAWSSQTLPKFTYEFLQQNKDMTLSEFKRFCKRIEGKSTEHIPFYLILGAAVNIDTCILTAFDYSDKKELTVQYNPYKN